MQTKKTRQAAYERIAQLPHNDLGCWIWQGTTSEGYGSMMVEGRRKRAHTWAYELFIGPIGEGLCVLHTCDDRLCCCPQHLVLGTRAQNMAEMYARGRASTSEQRRTFGRRKLTEAQVREIDELYEAGCSQQALADVFGVHQTAISKVIRRESWQHMPKS